MAPAGIAIKALWLKARDPQLLWVVLVSLAEPDAVGGDLISIGSDRITQDSSAAKVE